MGGHGALTLYLSSLLSGSRQYRSASAFAPIANPSKAPWGEKAFKGYLDGGMDEGREKYDATELVKKIDPKESLHILVDYVRWHPKAKAAENLLSIMNAGNW
jgi:S-formylglutathione hydrolase